MNVLSLFDGMSCGQIALERAGIKVDNYYASEIDKHAIAVTQHNYPNTIQLGDVTQVRCKDGVIYAGEKWAGDIDLLIGGSPCTGFSLAGKQLNFNDVQSKLFFEYVRLLNEVKPRYFLLENVKMKKEYQDKISQILGVEPILINSSLVSAQNRERLYWTNIPGVVQPQNKNIVMKDVLHDSRIYYSDLVLSDIIHIKDFVEYKCKATRENNPDKIHQIGYIRKNSQGNRVYATSGKSATLSASGGGLGGKTGLYKHGLYIRKLLVQECETLQTVPRHYTDVNGISNQQRYKMIGNGWTVDIISHILKNIQ